MTEVLCLLLVEKKKEKLKKFTVSVLYLGSVADLCSLVCGVGMMKMALSPRAVMNELMSKFTPPACLMSHQSLPHRSFPDPIRILASPFICSSIYSC